MNISKFHIFTNNGMMGIKIYVFEAADSISGLIFIPSVIILAWRDHAPLLPMDVGIFSVLLILSYIVEMGIKIWVFEVTE